MKTTADLLQILETVTELSYEEIRGASFDTKSFFGYDEEGWYIDVLYTVTSDSHDKMEIIIKNLEAWHYDEDSDIMSEFDEDSMKQAKSMLAYEIENIKR